MAKPGQFHAKCNYNCYTIRRIFNVFIKVHLGIGPQCPKCDEMLLSKACQRKQYPWMKETERNKTLCG